MMIGKASKPLKCVNKNYTRNNYLGDGKAMGNFLEHATGRVKTSLYLPMLRSPGN